MMWIKRILRENKYFILFIALMVLFRSAVADWNDVPSGSMKPTILEGDRILVDKLAYDLRVPFTLISLKKFDDPKRGDIVIIESAVSNKRLVKRVVALPGDRVAMRGNQIWLNGETLNYSSTDTALDIIENLSGIEHLVRLDPNGSRFSSFSEVQVPEGQYLVLGDNRDNSADSRVIGFVPRKEIIGRTERVLLSLNYDNYYLPRMDRFFVKL